MSILDYDNVFYDLERDKKIVEEWIKDNYTITGKLTISDDLTVDCSGNVAVNNKYIESLTNGLFRWGNVEYDFKCTRCVKLESLKGSPEEVGSFYCGYCVNLTSLEGAPKKINIDFWCNDCNKLETLKGAPEEIGGSFYCNHCINLKSLEGSPKKVGGEFVCNYCKGLINLKGVPEKINRNLCCWGCDSLNITMMDRDKYSINR